MNLEFYEREDFLNRVCVGNSQLRDRIQELLEADESVGGLLDAINKEPSSETSDFTSDPTGATVGSYKLLQKIGEGGFGVVYMAEQLRPVKRKVAFKVIKPGMDSKAVVARFEAERQALAMMEHPHIANVFDGGSTNEGRPYFVMELGKGVPITTYCDDNKLSIKERLAQFIHVCEAVQHAHQKGIIHRDIKPSNVMVTLHDGKPVVKVIDFGVAKAMHTELTEKTLFTAYGQMIGTPQYMSPEQAEMSGLDIDTRSDIYSLGVLLYELLTGVTPLEVEELTAGGFAGMQKLIKDKEPPRPSLRLSSAGDRLIHLARQRSIDPKNLPREIRGELDWIVMKALEKERKRRFGSAGEFAADIERFLSGDAVEACPPTLRYRLGKVVNRYRKTVAALALIFATMILGITGLAIGWVNSKQLAQTQVELREATEESKAQLQEKARTLRAERDDAQRKRYAAVMRAASIASAHPSGERLVSDALREFRPRVPEDDDLRGWEWYLFASGKQPELTTLASPMPIAMDWSPVADRLITAHLDGSVMLWDGTDGSANAILKISASPVTRVRWSPCGERILAVGLNGHASLWNTTTWCEELVVEGANGDFAWGPKGDRVAIADGAFVRIWHIPSRVESSTFSASGEWISWSPDGNWLVAASTDGLAIWDVAKNRREAVVPLSGSLFIAKVGYHNYTGDGTVFHWSENVLSIALQRSIQQFSLPSWEKTQDRERLPAYNGQWAPGGSRFVSNTQGDFRITNLLDEQPTIVNQVDGTLENLAWHPDGETLALVNRNRTLTLWDVKQNTSMGSIDLPSGPGLVAWNTVGDKIAIATDRLHILDLKHTDPIPRRGHSFSLCRDDRHVAIADGTDSIRIWDLLQKRESNPVEHDGPIMHVEFSPSDASLLAGLSADENEIVVWDISEARVAHRRSLPQRKRQLSESDVYTNLRLERSEINRRMTWSRNGHLAARRADDSMIHIWKLGQDGVVTIDSGNYLRHYTQTLVMSPNGDRIVPLPTPWVDVFHIPSGDLIRLPGHDAWERNASWVSAADWTADGGKLVTGCYDGTIRVWNVHDGTLDCNFERHLSDVYCVAWSPDENRIASGDDTGQIKIWDIVTQREVATIQAGDGRVEQLAWTRDGTRLVASLSATPTLVFLDAFPAYLRSRSVQSLATLNRRLLRKAKPDDFIIRAEIHVKNGDWNGVLRDVSLASDALRNSQAAVAMRHTGKLYRIELMRSIAFGELGDLERAKDSLARAHEITARQNMLRSADRQPSSELGMALNSYAALIDSTPGPIGGSGRERGWATQLAVMCPESAVFHHIRGVAALRDGEFHAALAALRRSIVLGREETTDQVVGDAHVKLFKVHFWWHRPDNTRNPNIVWQVLNDKLGLTNLELTLSPESMTDVELYLQLYECPIVARSLLFTAIAEAKLGKIRQARQAYGEAADWLGLEASLDAATLGVRAEALCTIQELSASRAVHGD